MDSQSPVVFNDDSPLHVATRQGRIEDVRTILVQQQVDVNILNSKHQTPLHLACSKRDSAVVQLLIAFGADPFIQDSDNNNAYGNTSHDIGVLMDSLLNYCTIWINSPTSTNGDSLLHEAVRLGELENIQRILEQYSNGVNNVNSLNETPLHIACALGHKQIVYLLVSKGADMYKKDCGNNAPIHRAVSKGHLDIMDSLIITFLCDPKLKGYQGRTLLHYACGVGNADLVNTLIEKYGINPLAIDAVNQTALHVAASHGQEEVLCLLITKYNHPVECKRKSNLTPLHLACFCGHLNIVITLLTKHGADLEACSDGGSKPIHQAAAGGHIDIVKMLILDFGCSPPLHYTCLFGHCSVVRVLVPELKAKVMVRDHENDTPISKAALNGHTDVVQMLITEFDCSPQVKGFESRSLLHQACDKGHTKLAVTLIADFKLDPLSIDDSGYTPLHMACGGGHEKLASLLITKYNCPVDIKDKNNSTPLHWACYFGHLSVVRMLVSKFKAIIDTRNYQNNTPLSVAVLNGHIDIVQMLIIEFGCSPQVKVLEGKSLLHLGCSNGSTKLAMTLITDFDLDSLSVDDNGDTSLHMACGGGHEELASLLITKYNCPVDIKDKNNNTPLHWACSLGHLGVVKMLVSEFKANYDTRNYQNDTPLSVAVLNGHTDIVQMLITEFGCSPQVKGFEGRSLLHQACDKGHTKLAMILIADFKLDPLSIDDDGDTPLHMACWGGHEELARLLITKYNCPVDIKNKYNKTPLHLACFFGQLSVVRMLVSESKTINDTPNYQNDTPLSIAVLNEHTDIVQMLITEFGCSPQVKGLEGRSLLHLGCSKGSTKLAMTLITDFDLDPLSVDDNGDTPLHVACGGGHEELARLLITKFNCPVDVKNKNKQTPLFYACKFGYPSVVRILISEYKASFFIFDYQNSSPIEIAALQGCADVIQMLITEFYFSTQVKGFGGRSLLHHASIGGKTELAVNLITNFDLDPLSVDDSGNTPLHMACGGGHEELARLLITKYNCPVDIKNQNKETPLHLACFHGHLSVVRLLIQEFKADLNAQDYYENSTSTPLGKAALGGHVDLVQMLISEFDSSTHFEGFGQSLLHYACSKGNVLIAKALIKESPILLHSTDNDGYSPLHLSSAIGQAECVRLLLFDYHAPIFIKNKAGKSALHVAQDESIKKIFKEYMRSEHKSIQQEYEKLQTLSLKKYAGSQIITRIFVLGYPGSGKSTLVESLKRKGLISSRLRVSQKDVPPHTAGIVPSTCQSKESGRLLYYDFAGDGEYYSSHGAILEMISHSTVGTNVYVIVANLTKDDTTLCNEIGYWLTFISCYAMNMDSQHILKVVVVLSHSDCLSVADSANRLDSIKQYYQKDNVSTQKLDIIGIVSSDCRRPRSSQVIENILQQISRDTSPYSISFETSLLHGLLQKDFGKVVICKLQDLLSHIKDTGICLPTVAKDLYPLVKELHEIGVLMMIGQNKDQLEDHFLLLDPSSLTNEVHQRLFSDSARQKFSFSVSPYSANMGILPESYLGSILPEHITKECLIQLQYCQEFTHAEVGLNYLITPDDALNGHLLYFPALCKLESEQSDWPTDPKLTFSIGWYTKCTGKFDYFPARYLHVLLLRLAFTFALRIVNCNTTESNEVSAHNRRCTMWKNGIRWLMEEGVECIFEMVNDNKGIVVITKSEEHSEEWATILGKIIDKAMQAKSEFCDTITLHHFILNSDDTPSFVDQDKLFDINDIERVIRQGKNKIVSAGGKRFLDSSHLCVLRRYAYWGLCNVEGETVSTLSEGKIDIETLIQATKFQQKLDQILDAENGGVSKHLGRIADSMHEWEGAIAEQLGLTAADVAAIKTRYPGELKLQTRAALEQWKQKSGPNATYKILIQVFGAAGYREYVDTVYKLFY